MKPIPTILPVSVPHCSHRIYFGKGPVTYTLNKEAPKDVASDRMNLNREVLDKHYNKQSKEEQMETQRKYLNGL